MAHGRWIEFSLAVAPEGVEAVAEVFGRLADGGVAIEEAITPIYEEPGFIRHTDKQVIVRCYIPEDDRAPQRQRGIEEAIWYLDRLWPLGELQTRTVAEEDWAEAWKQYYSIFRIGRRCVIKPAWLDYEPLPDDVVIALDPGMAFGTGQHPTTAGCLAYLEELVTPGVEVLDVGTGSGILAIGALGLGAGHVVALDTDPIAVRAARANLDLSGFQDRYTLIEGSLPAYVAPASTFPLVVANIIASAIIALAPELRRVCLPQAHLVASGIIATREAETVAALEAAGFSLVSVNADGDWRTLLLQA